MDWLVCFWLVILKGIWIIGILVVEDCRWFNWLLKYICGFRIERIFVLFIFLRKNDLLGDIFYDFKVVIMCLCDGVLCVVIIVVCNNFLYLGFFFICFFLSFCKKVSFINRFVSSFGWWGILWWVDLWVWNFFRLLLCLYIDFVLLFVIILLKLKVIFNLILSLLLYIVEGNIRFVG